MGVLFVFVSFLCFFVWIIAVILSKELCALETAIGDREEVSL